LAESLFISDLHLSGERPDTLRLFEQFLEQRAGKAETLYILGDLFDFWIGDDLRDETADEVKTALRQLTLNGTRLRLMHGNRDFLLGEEFCAQTGAELLPDPSLIELQGIPTLLMHGDLLCTGDLAYQAFRKQIREPAFIKQFLSLPIDQRIATAREYRAKSGEANSMKAEEIMDVDQQAVEATLRRHAAIRLIHGHTHRPDLHRFTLDDQLAERYVLAEWYPQRAGYLSVSEKGWQVEPYPPQANT
jgi:UDP-2,3-diacylglucosamine hydrolase